MTKYRENEEFDDLLRLAKRSLDGEASDEESALLERYLVESSEAKRIYWRIVSDELALRARAEARSSSAHNDSLVIEHEEKMQGPLQSLLSTHQPWVLAASLMLVAAASLLAFRHSLLIGTNATKQQSPVADLQRASDAQWILGDGGRTPRVGGALLPGNYSLAAGIVELRFRSGVSAIIEGPASWELVSSMRARLNWGRMVTDVPPQAVGFEVNTDKTSVVDLGTRCGIHVSKQFGNESQTEVHVFEGLVELHPRLSGEYKIRRLITGQANLIDTRENNVVWSDITIRPEEFVHQLLPFVVIDPPGQRSKMVDDYADGNVTVHNQVYYPSSQVTGHSVQGEIDPAQYVAGDFSLSESGGALHGHIPAGAIDPFITLTLPAAIDVAEFPFFRVRLRTATNQPAAVYYYNFPASNASESRYAHEPIIGAVTGKYREIRTAFNVEGLSPNLTVNVMRFDPATVIKTPKEGRFLLDYIYIDRYLTAGLAEFDLDHEEYLQGWSCVGVEDPEISQSVLRGRTLTGRARISHVGQSIRTEKWSAIELRLKLDPQAGDAHLGWGKPGDDLSFGRSTPLPNQGDGEFHTYLIALKPQHGWTETITKIAVWPGQKSQCEFQLDYVRLLAMPEKGI